MVGQLVKVDGNPLQYGSLTTNKMVSTRSMIRGKKILLSKASTEDVERFCRIYPPAMLNIVEKCVELAKKGDVDAAKILIYCRSDDCLYPNAFYSLIRMLGL